MTLALITNVFAAQAAFDIKANNRQNLFIICFSLLAHHLTSRLGWALQLHFRGDARATDLRPKVAVVRKCSNTRQPNDNRKRRESAVPSVGNRDTGHAIAGENSSDITDAIDNSGSRGTALLSSEIERDGSGQVGVGSNHQESDPRDQRNG